MPLGNRPRQDTTMFTAINEAHFSHTVSENKTLCLVFEFTNHHSKNFFFISSYVSRVFMVIYQMKLCFSLYLYSFGNLGLWD